jgi:hypothetical protein
VRDVFEIRIYLEKSKVSPTGGDLEGAIPE